MESGIYKGHRQCSVVETAWVVQIHRPGLYHLSFNLSFLLLLFKSTMNTVKTKGQEGGGTKAMRAVSGVLAHP